MRNTKIKAYSKINIGLEILGKRTDGFHEINTIFSDIYLFDEITVSYDHDLLIECEPDPGIPFEENTIYKAAMALKAHYRLNRAAAKVQVQKNIPLGAGLGGGSTDAAAALFCLSSFWNIDSTFDELLKIANKLGSDVPYFLRSGMAVASGRGENLSYFQFRLPYFVLVVYPGINISTEWAYKNIDLTSLPTQKTDLKQILLDSPKNPGILKEKIVNHFEPLIFKTYPEIGKIKDTLYKTGAVFASLTGSGSAVYGFFETEDKAQKASSKFSKYQTFVCQP